MTTNVSPRAYIDRLLEEARAADQTPSAPELALAYVVQGCLPSGLPKFLSPKVAGRAKAEALAESMNAQKLNGLVYAVKEVYADLS